MAKLKLEIDIPDWLAEAIKSDPDKFMEGHKIKIHRSFLEGRSNYFSFRLLQVGEEI